MKLFYLLPLISILLTNVACPESMENLERNLKTHIIELSEKIGERNYIYYDALTKAADYIVGEFKRFGYNPQIQSYYMGNREYKNIIAVKKGNKKPQEVVIIGAHYDSVIGSPGANDNGSGVSALLELSRLLAGLNTDRTVKFIAFVNEEPPFFLSEDMGSRVYAKDAKKRGEDIKAMISLETIGYYSDDPNSQSYPLLYGLFYPDRGNFIGVVGNLRSRRLIKSIENAFKRNSTFKIIAVVAPEFVTGVNFSDQDSFWRYGYKGCMVTDTAFYRYPYYHSHEDTYDKVKYPEFTEVVKGFHYVLLELSKSNPSGNSAFIVPIGKVDSRLLKDLAGVLNERFKIPFNIKDSMEIPKDAFNPKRNQYNSSAILERLRKFKGEKVLGIIDKDLYVHGLNFVFGKAQSPGKHALISVTRLRQEFYGLPKDDKIFFDRVVKEAVHELGHTYGLGHCQNPKCVMYFSNSLLDTDRKDSSFCKTCLKKLR